MITERTFRVPHGGEAQADQLARAEAAREGLTVIAASRVEELADGTYDVTLRVDADEIPVGGKVIIERRSPITRVLLGEGSAERFHGDHYRLLWRAVPGEWWEEHVEATQAEAIGRLNELLDGVLA